MRAPPVERRHHSHRPFGRTGKREGRHGFAKIPRADEDVAVVDEQMIVPRLGNHLHQVADLAVRAENLRAHDHPNGLLRKFSLEFLDGLHRSVFHTVDAEENLIAPGIVLSRSGSQRPRTSPDPCLSPASKC